MSDSIVEGLVDELGGAAAGMRCSPAAQGWNLDFLSAAGALASSAAAHFANYILSAPLDFTLWDPTSIAPALRNSVQVVDNRMFSEVDVVKRVYAPLGLDSLAHLTLLASTGPRFLGWFGIWRERPFTSAEVHRLSGNVPAIREKLMAMDDLGTVDVSWSIVESTLEAMERPAFLVRQPNRVELANEPGRALLEISRRGVLSVIERALAGDTSEWAVNRFVDVGVADLALVTQRPRGVSFERNIDHSRRSWGLSATQVAVLRLVLRGFSNKEIAATLNRAEGTIELHVSAILKRAGVESRARLLAKFWESSSTGG